MCESAWRSLTGAGMVSSTLQKGLMNDLKSVLMAVEKRFGILLEFAHRCQEDGHCECKLMMLMMTKRE